VKASRFNPERIRGLRNKLGLSQRELGVLVGATIGAVASWEKGKFRPRGEKKGLLVGLRKVRKRDVRKLLAEKVEEKGGKKIPEGTEAEIRAKRRIPRGEK
jgi:transcriptional regulator with XRE-family HTH domain